MVFNDLEKHVTKTLCTLVNIVGNDRDMEQEIVLVGQHLGLSKDDIHVVLQDWDELDVMEFGSEKDKVSFVKNCFAFVGNKPGLNPESELYKKVLERLDLHPTILN